MTRSAGPRRPARPCSTDPDRRRASRLRRRQRGEIGAEIADVLVVELLDDRLHLLVLAGAGAKEHQLPLDEQIGLRRRARECSPSAKCRSRRGSRRTVRPFPCRRRCRRRGRAMPQAMATQPANAIRDPARIRIDRTSVLHDTCLKQQRLRPPVPGATAASDRFDSPTSCVADAIDRAGPVVGHQDRTVLGQDDVGRTAEIALCRLRSSRRRRSPAWRSCRRDRRSRA